MTIRDQIGYPEDIAVVGPRMSGKTTLCTLLAQYHSLQDKNVLISSPHGPKKGFHFPSHLASKAGGYSMVHKDYQPVGLPAPQVVIHDGYIPGRPCRVISTSEIF